MTRGVALKKHCKRCDAPMVKVAANRRFCDKCLTPTEKKHSDYMRNYHRGYRSRVNSRVTQKESAYPLAQRLEESATRRRVPMCQACCNIADRRPLAGCPPRTVSAKGKLLTCGLPHGEEEAIKPHIAGFSALYTAQRER